ncbi:MAG: hypothetical protein KDC05_12340 [Bacteroidales bacterium]|nr:hypothetical protein [Bacteroidales bacterium]
MKKTYFSTIFAFLLFASLSLQSQEEAMNYKELQGYLPASISGYEAGEPGGQTTNMQGMSFSSADIKFTNSSGGYIQITLLDYKAAINMYQAATAMWNAGMSFENDDQIARSVQWEDDIAGWEEFRKKDKEGKIALGIGNRFFLSIEANQQEDLDFVKSIAKKMDLKSLASK